MYKYALLFWVSCFLLLNGCGGSDSGGSDQAESPDLIVTDLDVTSWTPDAISYSFTITNIGDSPANLDGPSHAENDNVSVQAFLSADTVFNNDGDIAAGGTVMGPSPLGELRPGESMTGSFSSRVVVDPSATPYLVLMVDWGGVVDETDETNNTLAVEIPQPDLVVSSLTVTSWTPGFIEYTYTITNIGNTPANLDGATDAENDNVSVQAFLSADTVFNNDGDIAAGGSIVGPSSLGELAPGESRTGSFSSSAVVEPAVTPYLVLMVDWGEVVGETDETNNTLAVEIPQVDLVVSALAVTSWTSSSIEYTYTITNNGSTPANLDGPTNADYDNVSVQAYLSGDNILDPDTDIPAGGAIMGMSPLGALAPGESKTGSFSAGADVDPDVTPYLVVMVDWEDVVFETNETNNTFALEIPQPDLLISNLTVTSWTMGSIEYSYTITNNGDAPVNLDGPTDADYDNVSVRAVLSADTVFDGAVDIPAGETIVGMSPLGILEPGASLTRTFDSSVTVDPSVTPYLVMKVDSGEVVDESDEDNNTLSAEIPLPNMPDLVVSSLAVVAYNSDSITYSYTITNVGDAPAYMDGPSNVVEDNVKVQAVLSNDTVFSNSVDFPAGGTVVSSDPVGNLDPGGSLSGTFTSTVAVDPETMAYLVLMVDSNQDVAESIEGNNTLAVGIGRPDLVISDLSMISWNLNYVEYALTITNMGDGHANINGPTNGTSDNVSIQAYLSADTVFGNAGDIAAGGFVTSMAGSTGLAPGASISESFGSTVAVDPGVTPYLVLKVDWTDVLTESDEDNNTGFVEITENGLPDLVVSSLEITSITSTYIQYDFTIANTGDAPVGANADNVSIQAVLSADTVFNNKGDIPAGGMILSSSDISNLGPGKSFDGSFGASISILPITQVSYLVLMVDWGSKVYESDETNNTHAAPIKTLSLK